MTATEERCRSQWKAAALEEGRLEGADRTSFEQHARGCAACTSELASLAVVREEMARLPAPRWTPLEKQRQRARLLEAADGRFTTRAGSWRRHTWRLTAAAAGVAILIAGIFVMAGHRRAAQPVAIVASPEASRLEVLDTSGAIWRHRAHGAVPSVELAHGSATFVAIRGEPEQRFRVFLPDAEIEVTHGRVAVDVDLGETRSVMVTEGHVSFRRRGVAAELMLHEGERWSREDHTPVVAASAAATSVRKIQPTPSGLLPSAAAPPVLEPPSRVAGERFGEAVASFVSGEYRRADRELEEFARAFPNDARCEEAAFLRAVANLRLGDEPAARSLARAYLDRYPHGLRRRAAARMVGTDP